MNDSLPTEEQLRRMERTVMARIRRRAQLPKRIAGGAAAAALVVGGVLLLPRLVPTGGGSAASGGSSGGGSTAVIARCHTSAAASSSAIAVPLAENAPKAALAACVRAWQQGRVTPEAQSTSGSNQDSNLQRDVQASDLVACLDDRKVLQVFLKDADPSTLCTRNGMHPLP